MIKEIFKDIAEYENLYQISNLGNVKSLNYKHTGKEKILTPDKDRYGYFRVVLHKQGKRKKFFVHRLVASAFIENPNNYPQVNHRDEDKTNNTIQNLEFCTPKYNANYGTRNKRVTEKKSKQVLCVETGVVYPSTMEAERKLGFTHSHISNVCNGIRNTCGGLHWKYV